MLYDLTLVQCGKMLSNIAHFLDKAVAHSEEKKFDVANILQARLAPDQFDLIRQIQVACDSTKLGVARLIGKVESAPKHADTETTVAELKARIASVQEYLATITPDDFIGAEERIITNAYWQGNVLNGYDYALQYMLPNVYFHTTTAYAIMRHNGVVLGKLDFFGTLPFMPAPQQ